MTINADPRDPTEMQKRLVEAVDLARRLYDAIDLYLNRVEVDDDVVLLYEAIGRPLPTQTENTPPL